MNNVLVTRLDVLDLVTIENAIQQGIQKFGKIDVLLNNAGYGAYEPHPLFFERLERNVKKNNFDIYCYKQAVSNFDGNLSIEDFSRKAQKISVDSVTLNKFILQNNISSIDLIKIDVETFEPQVMEGFSKYLSAFKPTMIIEILDDHVAEKIFYAVKTLNYLYFNINENGGIRQTKTIEKSDYYNYLLCCKEVAVKLGLIQNGS